MTKNKIKVIIADDHVFLRKGLIQIISETPDLAVVAEADDGEDLLEKIRATDLDVVVMDVEMPKKSGWDVMLQLKAEKSKLPVVILSVFSEEDYAIKFFKAGASGYLTKTSAPELLVEAIRKVASGGRFISPTLTELLAFELGRETENKPHEKLTAREFQIFTMIASGKTVKEIALELSLSIPTISTHRAHILEKMNLKTNARLTHYAFKNNIVK